MQGWLILGCWKRVEGLYWRVMGDPLRGKQHSTVGMRGCSLLPRRLWARDSVCSSLHFSIWEMDSIKMCHSER